MFGIGPGEVIMLVALAIIMFGPDKIPELSRKAARIVHFLRGIANNAQNQLRAELGPEFADLELKDLNPRNFVQKHVLEAIQADIDDIKADLVDVKQEVDSSAKDAAILGESLRHEMREHDGVDELVRVPFDVDAT